MKVVHNSLQIGIVGPGAIGHMIAFFVQKSGQNHALVWGRKGPQSLAASIEWQSKIEKLDLSSSQQSCDLVFVAVKSYDLTTALETALPSFKEGTPIIVLSNGYIDPLLASIQEKHPKFIWRKGLVMRGVRNDGEGQYIVGPRGDLVWGGEIPIQTDEQMVLQDMRDFGFKWTPDIDRLRRSKWFFNTVLNTVCAVYRLPQNGDALRFFEQDLKICSREAYELGEELWSDWDSSWEQLWLELKLLIQNTAGNENSMARDVRLGRKTEGAALSGCVALSAKAAKYPLLQEFNRRLSGLNQKDGVSS